MGSATRNGRPRGVYRFSDRFIARTTAVLLSVMGVLVVAGIVLGVISDSVSGEAGDTISTLGMAIVIAGFVLPVLIAAIIGGEAIMAGAGVIGFGLVGGAAIAIVSGTEFGQSLFGSWATFALWSGIGLTALCVVAFWIVGFKAKVPMWIQAPFIRSPRVYVRGRSENPTDVNVGAESNDSGKESRRHV